MHDGILIQVLAGKEDKARAALETLMERALGGVCPGVLPKVDVKVLGGNWVKGGG